MYVVVKIIHFSKLTTGKRHSLDTIQYLINCMVSEEISLQKDGTFIASLIGLLALAYTASGAYDGYAQGPRDKGYNLSDEEMEQVKIWKELFRNHRQGETLQ